MTTSLYGLVGLVLLIVSLLVASCSGTWVNFQNAASPVETVQGLLAKPNGDRRFAAVILLHTAGGLAPYVARDWPRYLNGLGYVTLSVDSFGSRGLGSCGRARHVLCGDGGASAMMQDAYGALEYLAGLPFVDRDNIAVMGFSLGARAVNMLVGNQRASPTGGNFKAAIAMYSNCNFLYLADKDMIPVVQIVGEFDDWAQGCKLIAQRRSVEVHVLAKAFHAFDNPGAGGRDPRGNTMSYNAEATKKAQEIVKSFLAKHLRTL